MTNIMAISNTENTVKIVPVVVVRNIVSGASGSVGQSTLVADTGTSSTGASGYTAWRLSAYMNTTNAGSGGTVTVTWTYQDGNATTHVTGTLDLTALGAHKSEIIDVFCAPNSSIKVQTTVAASGGSPVYFYQVLAEKLSN